MPGPRRRPPRWSGWRQAWTTPCSARAPGGLSGSGKLGIGADVPVAVCVSRIVPRKGQDTLIEAWPRVLAEMGQAKPVLLIVGGGNYARKLRRLAHRLKVSDSVIFAGFRALEDLAAYYDAGNVFCDACAARGRVGTHVEGLWGSCTSKRWPPLVIGGDSGGAPDGDLALVSTGYVVKGGDEVELAAAAGSVAQRS